MFNLKFLTVCVVFGLLAGCSQPTVPNPEPTGTTAGAAGGADTGGYGQEGLGAGEDVPYDPSAGELANVVYFDFDSSELRPDETQIVTRHAQQLASHPELKVRLEGHADERGSREYNIGLGERRAQTVRRLLLIQGASADQISTVSFGEERPAVMGSTEEAYAKNRRVEFKYMQ